MMRLRTGREAGPGQIGGTFSVLYTYCRESDRNKRTYVLPLLKIHELFR